MLEFAIGIPEPSEADLERCDAIIDAEDVLTAVLRHVARTSFAHNDVVKLQLAMSAIMGAFACVERARSEVR